MTTNAIGKMNIKVIEKASHAPIEGALVHVAPASKGKQAPPPESATSGFTDSKGELYLELEPGKYRLTAMVFGYRFDEQVEVQERCHADVDLKVPLDLEVGIETLDNCSWKPCVRPRDGDVVRMTVEHGKGVSIADVDVDDPGRSIRRSDDPRQFEFVASGVGPQLIPLTILGPEVEIDENSQEHRPLLPFAAGFESLPAPRQYVAGNLNVSLGRNQQNPTDDQPLWVAIRNRAVSFENYMAFIDALVDKDHDFGVAVRVLRDMRLPDGRKPCRSEHLQGVTAYETLKVATQIFLLRNCGIAIPDKLPAEETLRLGFEPVNIQHKLRAYLGDGLNRLPYLERVIDAAFPHEPIITNPLSYGILSTAVECPCLIELIWSYWHEEGMLVQAINAVSRRFQNVRGPAQRDPLAHLEIDPLRPLNSVLWGYVQDEQHRLTVKRRAYEYDHHYGLKLWGKALGNYNTADSRSKFLEGFHNLLHLATVFFKEDNDATMIPDGFPMLNALKEVHRTLAQGAHNQFGDLPWTARVEMLIQQWIMARPETRDFLQSRAMVPYQEPWMSQVDTMKTMQGWSDVSVSNFRDLGVFGEQLLLTIRYADWIGVTNEESARNWARYWRPEIQTYIHAYRAVTGVDLANPDNVDFTSPSVHLRRRLADQRRAG